VRGVDEGSGHVLSAAVVAGRADWLAALARGMTAALLEEHWSAGDVRALASGLDALGRPLPSRAWMACRRLGWNAAAVEGVRVNDRVCRMAQQQAGRLLRSAAARDALITAVIATWPAVPAKRAPGEWDALRAAVPGGADVPTSMLRARTRQTARFLERNGRLPADLFELEDPPTARGMLLLAACDRQMATLERDTADPSRALLRVKLPTRPDPRSHKDWSWVAIPLFLPLTVPAGAVLHLPTLRVAEGRLQAEMPFTLTVPAARRAGHAVALGIDWGLNTLLSAGVARLGPDGAISALGAGAQYRANGVLAKQTRLRRRGEALRAKINCYERLIGDDPGRPLAAKAEALREEERRVAARRSHLNDALAWSAARWALDQALAASATAVYLEDLTDLEARGMGKTMNTRLSQTVRGAIAEKIRHLAAEYGIAVVTVPPQGTSKNCPVCLAPLRHCKSPDRPGEPGWKWARCTACGWQGDRDIGAWMRIAARGLAHQAKTSTDRAGAITVRAIDPGLEPRTAIAPYTSPARDRSKCDPTPRRKKNPRPAPRRRGTPSPSGSQRPDGQRPEGRVSTAREPLPRAATRDQGASTTCDTPARTPHRARGAALGAGFHLHAHATPPRRESVPQAHPAPPTGWLRILEQVRDATRLRSAAVRLRAPVARALR